MKEVLRHINLGNKNLALAGILSPLTDSNRRPPPYHGGWDALRRVGRFWLPALFFVELRGFAALIRGRPVEHRGWSRTRAVELPRPQPVAARER